jgi:hypothetical protein
VSTPCRFVPEVRASRAAWLARYLDEREPTLLDFAQMAATLAQRPD